MKEGKWFELWRKYDLAGLPYSWPETTHQMWKDRVSIRAGLGICETFTYLKKSFYQINPHPAIMIIFPNEYPMSGHLASVRKVWENLQIINYECWRTGVPISTPGRYFYTSSVVIWTKYILRKLAELSPVFAPIWEDLKNIAATSSGIYLADEPDAAWLESILPCEEQLFAEFRDGARLDMIGLDMPSPGDKVAEFHKKAVDLMIQKKYDEAKAGLLNIIERWPRFWQAHYDLALSAMWQDDMKGAYETVRHAQDYFPDALYFDHMAVECCIQLREWSRAQWHLNRLCELNPWDPNIMLRCARVAYMQGNYDLSANIYYNCSDCGALSYEAAIEYGSALNKLRRFREALVIFRALEREYPSAPELLNHIGFTLAADGNPVAAIRYCHRALELEPNREYIWDSLGYVQMKTGNYREAARSFLKAINLTPTYPDAWRHLLHTYYKEGKYDRLESAKSYVASILPDQLIRFESEKGSDVTDS